jgi:endonuclease/exonuclease/phosphatase family metal-dependent hydrolase
LSTAVSLTVATYNIHSCIGIDRDFAPARIAKVLGEINADIVCLQEVGWHLRGKPQFDQFDFLQNETGYAVIAGLTKNHSKAHFGNAVLTRHPVVDVEPFDLTIPMHYPPRGGISVDIKIGAHVMRILNVHFGLSPLERRAQGLRLLQRLEALDDRPIGLFGDFNEWGTRSGWLRRIHRRLPREVSGRSYPSRMPVLRLDRMFFSENIALHRGAVYDSTLSRLASDHLPLVATIEIEAAPAFGA